MYDNTTIAAAPRIEGEAISNRQARREQFKRTIAVLAELSPHCFVVDNLAQHCPLKIGIHADLVATGLVTPRECTIALTVYCGRLMYQAALAAGGARVGLDGAPAGEVTPDEIEHALAAVARLEVKAIAKAKAARKDKALRTAARERATQQEDASLNPQKMGVSKALSVENKPGRPDCQPAPRTPPPPPSPPSDSAPRRLGLSDLKRAAVERRNGGSS
jgi:sRNA-binding protein